MKSWKKAERRRKEKNKNAIFKNNTQLYRQKCQTINWIITDIKITASSFKRHEKFYWNLIDWNRKKAFKGLTQPSTVKTRRRQESTRTSQFMNLCVREQQSLRRKKNRREETRNSFKQEKNVNRMIVNQRWFFPFFVSRSTKKKVKIFFHR